MNFVEMKVKDEPLDEECFDDPLALASDSLETCVGVFKDEVEDEETADELVKSVFENYEKEKGLPKKPKMDKQVRRGWLFNDPEAEPPTKRVKSTISGEPSTSGGKPVANQLDAVAKPRAKPRILLINANQLKKLGCNVLTPPPRQTTSGEGSSTTSDVTDLLYPAQDAMSIEECLRRTSKKVQYEMVDARCGDSANLSVAAINEAQLKLRGLDKMEPQSQQQQQQKKRPKLQKKPPPQLQEQQLQLQKQRLKVQEQRLHLHQQQLKLEPQQQQQPQEPQAEAAVTRMCDFCNFRSATKTELEIHVNSKHRLKCQLCPFSTGKQYLLIAHISTTHPGVKVVQSFKCNHCEEETDSLEVLDSHVVHVHEKRRDFLCKLCKKSYTTLLAWHMHQLNVHKIMDGVDILSKHKPAPKSLPPPPPPATTMPQQIVVVKSEVPTPHFAELILEPKVLIKTEEPSEQDSTNASADSSQPVSDSNKQC